MILSPLSFVCSMSRRKSIKLIHTHWGNTTTVRKESEKEKEIQRGQWIWSGKRLLVAEARGSQRKGTTQPRPRGPPLPEAAASSSSSSSSSYYYSFYFSVFAASIAVLRVSCARICVSCTLVIVLPFSLSFSPCSRFSRVPFVSLLYFLAFTLLGHEDVCK